MLLASTDDLTVQLDDNRTVHLSLGGRDWFGPGVSDRRSKVGVPTAMVDDLGSATTVLVVDDDARCIIRAYSARRFNGEMLPDDPKTGNWFFDVVVGPRGWASATIEA